MKTFTCKEMGGPCDMEFDGETMEEVASKGGQHIMTTIDEGHKPMKYQMTSGTEEGKKEWFVWFKGLWDAKTDDSSQKGFANPVLIGIVAVVVVVVIMFGYYIMQKQPEVTNDKAAQESAMMEKEKNETTMTEEQRIEQEKMEKKAMEQKTTDNGGAMMEKEESTMIKAGSYEAYTPEKVMLASDTHDVVLFFRASWCPSCRIVDADIKANLSKIPSSLAILDVNYDNSTALKQKYGVTYQHTFVQVDKDGNLIKKWSGSPTLSALVAEVK